MNDQIVTIAARVETQFEEKKSRFLSYLAPVSSKEEAEAFVKEISLLHRDARHNCYCWRLRDGSERSSDNGEPSGTAGIPMLQVLQKADLTDLCLVVTRYFGGILLGAPGLVRAYSKGASMSVEAAEKVVLTPCHRLSLDCPYPLYDRLEYLLSSFPHKLESSSFFDQTNLVILSPSDATEELLSRISQIGSGRIVAKVMGETFAPIPAKI